MAVWFGPYLVGYPEDRSSRKDTLASVVTCMQVAVANPVPLSYLSSGCALTQLTIKLNQLAKLR